MSAGSLESGLSDWLLKKANAFSKGRDVWIWGTGASAQSFLSLSGIRPKGFIESNPASGKIVNGMNVHSPDILPEVKNSNGIVFIMSMFLSEIEPILHQYDFSLGRDYVSPTDILSGGHQIILYAQNIHEYRQVINWLNSNINYVKLRWFDNFIVPNDDWDVLVERHALSSLLTHPLLQGPPSPYSFDFKWSSPIGFVDEFIYYPTYLSKRILSSRQWDERGFYRVSDDIYKYVFAYHCVFQKKAASTELPIESEGKHPNNKFSKELISLGFQDISLVNLWNVAQCDWIPPVSDIRRWASVHKSYFLRSKVLKRRDYLFLPSRSGYCIHLSRVNLC